MVAKTEIGTDRITELDSVIEQTRLRLRAHIQLIRAARQEGQDTQFAYRLLRLLRESLRALRHARNVEIALQCTYFYCWQVQRRNALDQRKPYAGRHSGS